MARRLVHPRQKFPPGDAAEMASQNRTPFERRLGGLLDRVAAGTVTPEAAAEALRDLPFADLGFAKVDHHRELRQGACEVVYAEPNSVEAVAAILGQPPEGKEGH